MSQTTVEQPQSERDKVESWRLHVLIEAGYPLQLAERLATSDADFGQWNPAGMKIALQREWDCPFNWKVLVENFMESYHHLGIHHRTLQPMMPALMANAKALYRVR